MSGPRLGEAFVCLATAESGVEWVVIATAESAGGPLLVVPADTSPEAGSADVAVAASEAGTPLTLRGRFSLWVRPSLLVPALRTRTLATATCRAAAAKVDALLTGGLAGEPIERETDEDFEHQSWLAAEIAPAHRALAAANAAVIERDRSPSPAPGASRIAYAIAASLAALSLGLGHWALVLHQRVSALRAPVGNVSSVALQLGDTTRGELTAELAPESERFLLLLGLDYRLPAYPSYRLEVYDHDSGDRLWTREGLKPLLGHELSIELPAPERSWQRLELRVFGIEAGDGASDEALVDTTVLLLRRRSEGEK